MRVKNMFSALLACMSLLIASCGSGDKIEYIAFRNGENMWGLVAPNGEVLFEGKFKHKPSLVLHGVFSVKNDEGVYEIYTAEAEPQRVGETYAAIGEFFDGVAPAVPALGYVRYINTKGETEFELKEADGKPVAWAGNFHDGRARFKSNGKFGYIDRNGKVAVSAVYAKVYDFHDGRAVVYDTLNHWHVIDDTGNIIFGQNSTDGQLVCYEDYAAPGYSEGLLPVKNAFDDLQLYDTDGKPVGEPIPFRAIQSFKNGVAVLSYKNKQALVNTKGEPASTSLYQHIKNNGHLRFAQAESRGKMMRLDDNGKQVGGEEYVTVSLYPSFVKGSDKYIIERNYRGEGNVVEARSGKKLVACQSCIDFEFKERPGADSEFVDTDKIFALLNITVDGLGEAKLDQSAAEIGKALGLNANEYPHPDFMAFSKETPECGFCCDVQFSDYMFTESNPRAFRQDVKADEINATLTLHDVKPAMCKDFFVRLVRHISKICGEDSEIETRFIGVEYTFYTPSGRTIYLLRKANVIELRVYNDFDGEIGEDDDMS